MGFAVKGVKDNLVGMRFGRWVVIGKSTKRRPTGHGIHWDCLCDCGTHGQIEGSSLRGGNSKSCGCGKLSRPPDASVWHFLHNQYRYAARNRALAWHLSDSEFTNLISGTCYYCGLPPSNKLNGYKKTLLYSGIDRVNNTIGYTMQNCVSCCAMCNFSKRHRCVADFESWILRAADHIRARAS